MELPPLLERVKFGALLVIGSWLRKPLAEKALFEIFRQYTHTSIAIDWRFLENLQPDDTNWKIHARLHYHPPSNVIGLSTMQQELTKYADELRHHTGIDFKVVGDELLFDAKLTTGEVVKIHEKLKTGHMAMFDKSSHFEYRLKRKFLQEQTGVVIPSNDETDFFVDRLKKEGAEKIRGELIEGKRR